MQHKVDRFQSLYSIKSYKMELFIFFCYHQRTNYTVIQGNSLMLKRFIYLGAQVQCFIVKFNKIINIQLSHVVVLFPFVGFSFIISHPVESSPILN